MPQFQRQPNSPAAVLAALRRCQTRVSIRHGGTGEVAARVSSAGTDLTFGEWEYAIDFLTRVGQKCTPSRQEFILLSDVSGFRCWSMP